MSQRLLAYEKVYLAWALLCKLLRSVFLDADLAWPSVISFKRHDDASALGFSDETIGAGNRELTVESVYFASSPADPC